MLARLVLRRPRHVLPRPRQLPRPAIPLAVRRYSELSQSTPPPPTSTQRLATEGVTIPIQPPEYLAILSRATQVWPAPPSIPAGWSASWADWSYLLTFYWLSPYFLMLPQIEMLVNIRYALPGETRPVLFQNDSQRFVFTTVLNPNRFFLFDGAANALFRIKGARDESALVAIMAQGEHALQAALIPMVPNPEGDAALARILDRDGSVVPLLAEKFLDYTPVPTTPWEEGHGAADDDVPPEHILATMSALQKEAEVLSRQAELDAERAGVDLDALRRDAREEEEAIVRAVRREGDTEVEEDAELDETYKELERALDNLDNFEDVEELMRLARAEEEATRSPRSTRLP
ncbi:hypothetical protein H0H81_006256 [Sphagnurus paluster]|uniref:Uncharacterized protein n=1 Tax=Sphagnurus paluster TaxID=117069 RepID=A0A9P7GK61_9AGAR|nr:hypothetical protein H0H81_006256 [Sphagnurus paluster]